MLVVPARDRIGKSCLNPGVVHQGRLLAQHLSHILKYHLCKKGDVLTAPRPNLLVILLMPFSCPVTTAEFSKFAGIEVGFELAKI